MGTGLGLSVGTLVEVGARASGLEVDVGDGVGVAAGLAQLQSNATRINQGAVLSDMLLTPRSTARA